jgi:hypothetical protein
MESLVQTPLGTTTYACVFYPTYVPKKKKITLTDPRHAVCMSAVPCQILKLVTNFHDFFFTKIMLLEATRSTPHFT